MKLSIITINYNGSQNTLKLLESLQDQTDLDFEIIVVDNASEKEDFEALSNYVNEKNRTTSQVVLFRNSQNLGFSGGNNVGIEKAIRRGSEWVVLLNNDTWVENNFTTRLRTILAQKQGIVGLPLDEGDQTAYCGKIEWLKPTLKHVYNMLNIRCLTYAIGGAVAIHKNVFEKIGFLDEKYFLYFEDADYTVKARKAKIPVTFAQDVMIYHNTSSTTKKLGSQLLLRYHYRNALYFNLKNGPWYIKLAVWPWSWWIALKQVFKIMIYHNREQSLAILKGVFDFYKNKTGKIT